MLYSVGCLILLWDSVTSEPGWVPMGLLEALLGRRIVDCRREYLVGVCLVWHLVQSGNITGGWYPLMIQCAFALQPVVPRSLSSAILHLVSCWGCPRVSIWGPQIHAGLHFLGQVPFQFFDKVAFSSQLSFQVGDCRGLQSCWFLHGSHHLCFHTAKHISDGVILTSAIDCILWVIRGMAIQHCCITSWVTHSAWLFSLRGVYDVRVINRHSLCGCHSQSSGRTINTALLWLTSCVIHNFYWWVSRWCGWW